MPYSNDGDVKIYSKKEVIGFLSKSGFQIVSYSKIQNSGYLVIAKKQQKKENYSFTIRKKHHYHEQNINRAQELIKDNVEALILLSVLYVKKYHYEANTQLITISSAGGYIMVPTTATYCASKFFVSSFTGPLRLELSE